MYSETKKTVMRASLKFRRLICIFMSLFVFSTILHFAQMGFLIRMCHRISTPPNTVPRKDEPKFIIEPEILKRHRNDTKCLEDNKVRFIHVTFVKSKLGNSLNRELVRRTWGSITHLGGIDFRAVFVVGSTEMKSLDLVKESNMYGDILQYVGDDNYRSVVYKTLAGMAWASSNLPTSSNSGLLGGYLYASSDDDMLLDLKELRENIIDQFYHTARLRFEIFPLICGFKRGTDIRPVRTNNKKWYISEKDYKWAIYPPFCHGGYYTMSIETMREIYHASRSANIFELDDVWITGLLRNKIGIPDSYVVGSRNEAIAKHFQGFQTNKLTRDGFRKEFEENMLPKLSKHRLCLQNFKSIQKEQFL